MGACRRRDKKKDSLEAWECPECNYIITDVEYQALRFDYGCPRCKNPFRHFHSSHVFDSLQEGEHDQRKSI